MHPYSCSLSKEHYSSLDRSQKLRVRDCYPLWYGIPADFCSIQGYSPPHPPKHYCSGVQLGLSGFHSLLLTGSLLISLPPLTKMLHFSGLLHITVLSQIPGSKAACAYPGRFAACRVALRTPAKPSTIWIVFSILPLLRCFWITTLTINCQVTSKFVASYHHFTRIEFP